MGGKKIGLAIHKCAERLGDTLKMRHESRIFRELIEAFLADVIEHTHRIVINCFPENGINASKEVHCVGIPGPAQVIGQCFEALKRFGKRRFDNKCRNGFHRDLSPKFQTSLTATTASVSHDFIAASMTFCALSASSPDPSISSGDASSRFCSIHRPMRL